MTNTTTRSTMSAMATDDLFPDECVTLHAKRLARILRAGDAVGSADEPTPEQNQELDDALRAAGYETHDPQGLPPFRDAADMLEALSKRRGLGMPLEIDLLATVVQDRVKDLLPIDGRAATYREVDDVLVSIASTPHAPEASISNMLGSIGAAYVLARRKQLSK